MRFLMQKPWKRYWTNNQREGETVALDPYQRLLRKSLQQPRPTVLWARRSDVPFLAKSVARDASWGERSWNVEWALEALLAGKVKIGGVPVRVRQRKGDGLC